MLHLADRTYVHFHYAHGFATQTLAYMLDSLVRVSRRVGYNYFVRITMSLTPKDALRDIAPRYFSSFSSKAFNSESELTFLTTHLRRKLSMRTCSYAQTFGQSQTTNAQKQH